MTAPSGPWLEPAALTTDDLLTGEAVALDLPAATVGYRIVSGLIDILVTVGSAFAVVLVLGATGIATDAALGAALTIVLLVTIFLIIPTTTETLTRGKSIGKAAMGLRTVRDDAGPISFRHAFVRALIGFVEIYLLSGVPAFFSALLSNRGKRLGDHAAGTFVIRERFPLRLPLPTPMPAELRGWADRADVADLPPKLALAIRQFIGRADQLTVVARTELGLRLAGQLTGYVAPAPPPGTAPEAFLAAVLATRRERDLNRLHREEALRRRLTARS